MGMCVRRLVGAALFVAELRLGDLAPGNARGSPGRWWESMGVEPDRIGVVSQLMVAVVARQRRRAAAARGGRHSARSPGRSTW